MISRGETLGTFQIESRAQIASILHTRPDRLYDIVVQVALIRPGPIQAKFVHPYTQRRRGRSRSPICIRRSSRSSPAPRASRSSRSRPWRSRWRWPGTAPPRPTCSAAPWAISESGPAPRRVGRSSGSALIAKGIDREVADRIEDDLLSFANYGFPESHAWSFALIAYATAYLKCHYPTEFLLGLLNAQPMGFYPIATLIHDARRAGVTVLPPCLARGAADCTTETDRRIDVHPSLRLGGGSFAASAIRPSTSWTGPGGSAPSTASPTWSGGPG